MDQKDIDRIFYEDGFGLAKNHLEKELSSVSLNTAISELYKAIDNLLEAFLQRAAEDGAPSDCKRGCAWCCHQEVFAISHEFLYLNDYVNQHLSPEARNHILVKAREKVQLTLNLSVEDQLKIRAACPFLESGSCLAYEARPMACRIYLSASARSCKIEHDEPDNQQHHPELYEFPLQAGRMLNEGFAAYLKERGLQEAELPIEQGFASMLTLGQNMDDWIASIPK